MNDVISPPGRSALEWIGNLAGPSALFVFGFALYHYTEKENIFSFAAWGALDFSMGVAMCFANSLKRAILPLAYGVICAFVVYMIYNNGEAKWGLAEWLCLIGAIIAYGTWIVRGVKAGVTAFGVALAIASVPILIDNYNHPNVWEWWLWIGSGISASAGLYLSRPLTRENMTDWLFTAISAVVTILMFLLLLRPFLQTFF